MKHLSEMRIMELALHDNLNPTPEEHSHLEECQSCQVTLSEERELSSSLSDLQLPAVPAHLLFDTVSRFQRKHRNAYQIPVLIGIILSVITGGVIVALLGIHHTALITTIIDKVAAVFTVGNVLLNLAGNLPYTVQLVEISLVVSFAVGLTSLVAGRMRAHVEINGPVSRTNGEGQR